METEIFIPMFYLVLLTTVVFLFATFLRLKEIYLDKILNKEGVDGEEFRHPPFETGSITLKNTQRNLSNLLEFPVLFYVICICIFEGVSWPGTKRGKRVNGCSTLFDPSGVEFLRPRGCNVAHALAKSPVSLNI